MMKGVLKKRKNAAISLASMVKNTFILFILLLAGWPGIAQAQLMIAPTRVVFEGRTRAQEVTLIHKGDKEATYRISFQHLRMKQDGSYEEIKEPQPNEQFADELVRYSPRQVTLKPGQSQAVRFMVRKPKNLPDGEYRSHVLFKQSPPKDMGADVEAGAKAKEEGKISVQLIPLYAVSIPVIVRHGNLTATAEIREAKVVAGEIPGQEKNPDAGSINDGSTSDKLLLTLMRSGNASAYGDITVTFTPEDTSKGFEVGRLGGISVLYPSQSRDLTLNLKGPEGKPFKKGKLNIVYQKEKDEGGAILATKTLQLD